MDKIKIFNKTYNLREKLDITYTALCLAEYRHDEPGSEWHRHIARMQDKEGAHQTRMYVQIVAEEIEAALYWLKTYSKELVTADDIMSKFGCYDFEFIPFISDKIVVEGCSKADDIIRVILQAYKRHD